MTGSVEHISEQLFKIIKGSGYNVILFTDDGQKTVEPAEARRFYAKDIQMMVNFVADEKTTEFIVNLSAGTDIEEIRGMLDRIRKLAVRYIVEYTVKTFGKTIGPKDFAFMAKNKVDEATQSQMDKRRYDANQKKLAALSKERTAAKNSGSPWKANDSKEKEYYRLKSDMNENKKSDYDSAINEIEQIGELTAKQKAMKQGTQTRYIDGGQSRTQNTSSPSANNLKDYGVDQNPQHPSHARANALLKQKGVKTAYNKGVTAANKAAEKAHWSREKNEYQSDQKAGWRNADKQRKLGWRQFHKKWRGDPGEDVFVGPVGKLPEDVNEGFSGWTGTARKSIQELGDARIIVRHKSDINEEKPGARSRQIETIFIENSEGERFKFPTRNLTAARAMLKHVKEGGTPFDDFGQYIYETMEEMTELKKFQRKNKNQDFFEDAQIVEEIGGRINSLRGRLKNMTTISGYPTQLESFTREKAEVTEERLDELKDTVTVRYFDEGIASSLPYVARIIEAFRTRQDKEEEIVNFARYVMKHKDNIELNNQVDFDDPESPSNRRYKDPATQVAAMVSFMAPYLKDDMLSNMAMQISDTVFEVGPKHVNMALQALNVVKQQASVAEQAQPEKIAVDTAQMERIEETFDKYNVRKIFGV